MVIVRAFLHSFLFLGVILLISCSGSETNRTYHENGTVESEIEMRDGVREGLARTYFESGALKFEGVFQKGSRIGWHISYDENGMVREKVEYVIANGKELRKRTLVYNEHGDLVSDFVFKGKQITVTIRNLKPYKVNDTLFVTLRIENAKHRFSEAILGDFDSNLNVLSYPEETPTIFHGNEDHEISMKIQVTKAGADTLKWIVRDYDFSYRTDSTGTSVGQESYADCPIMVYRGSRIIKS